MPTEGQSGEQSSEQQDGDLENARTTQQDGDHDDESFDREKAQERIRYLRRFERQSKEQERELAKLRAQLKDQDDAKLSETEKLTQRLAELEKGHQSAESALQEARLENAVLVAAHKQGAVDTDAVYRLLDREAIEFDSQGRPQGVDTAVKTLLKERPYLGRSPGSADGGAGNTTGRASSGLDLDTQIRRAMGRA